MNRLFRTLLLVLVAALAAASAAHAVDLTFQVRMAQQVALGNFDPAADSVDIAGTFNGWGGTLTPLADADGDTVYAITLGGFTAGETIEYKYRINGLWVGTEEFPGVGSNRIYQVPAADVLIDVWYNDLQPGGGTADPAQLAWWNDCVFYEIFVRSFYDSDGDGIGDLPGLTSQLDYLNDGDPTTDTDLGITGIWLMPIAESPSYHGYDATNYRAIEPDYGTMADFEAFLAAAHARGIKVIVDLVMNHCSSQHPWFTASRANDPAYRDWFRWSPTDPGETGPWGQQVWHQSGGDWYYGLFSGGMPDLNYDTPAVKQEMFDTAAWWLDTVGVDGFRLDAVLYIDEDPGQLQNTPGTLQFWQDFGTQVRAAKPDAMTVGEAWTSTSTALQYVTDDRLDLCFEFDLGYATMGAVNGGSAEWLRSKAAQVYGAYPYLQYATFLTNHDQDRSFSTLGEVQAKAEAAAALYLTQPGVPFVYYGEEIGMTCAGPDPVKRAPMQWDTSANAGFSLVEPWQPLGADWLSRNVAVEQAATGSLLTWYRKLIRLRTANSALRRGTYAPLGSPAPEVMAYIRRDGIQTLLCLVNVSGTALNGFDLSGLLGSLSAQQPYRALELLTGDWDEFTVTADYRIEGLALGPYEARIYELVTESGVDDETPRPRTGLRLEPNHPNPFNPSTTIRYDLPAASHVQVDVYDVAGRAVARLVDAKQDAGPQSVRWDGRDRAGRAAGTGVYFARVMSEHGVAMIKMALVK